MMRACFLVLAALVAPVCGFGSVPDPMITPKSLADTTLDLCQEAFIGLGATKTVNPEEVGAVGFNEFCSQLEDGTRDIERKNVCNTLTTQEECDRGFFVGQNAQIGYHWVPCVWDEDDGRCVKQKVETVDSSTGATVLVPERFVCPVGSVPRCQDIRSRVITDLTGAGGVTTVDPSACSQYDENECNRFAFQVIGSTDPTIDSFFFCEWKNANKGCQVRGVHGCRNTRRRTQTENRCDVAPGNNDEKSCNEQYVYSFPPPFDGASGFPDLILCQWENGVCVENFQGQPLVTCPYACEVVQQRFDSFAADGGNGENAILSFETDQSPNRENCQTSSLRIRPPASAAGLCNQYAVTTGRVGGGVSFIPCGYSTNPQDCSQDLNIGGCFGNGS